MKQVLCDPVVIGGVRMAAISDVSVVALRTGRGKASLRFFCRKVPRYVLIGDARGCRIYRPDGSPVERHRISAACKPLLARFLQD